MVCIVCIDGAFFFSWNCAAIHIHISKQVTIRDWKIVVNTDRIFHASVPSKLLRKCQSTIFAFHEYLMWQMNENTLLSVWHGKFCIFPRKFSTEFIFLTLSLSWKKNVYSFTVYVFDVCVCVCIWAIECEIFFFL